MDTGKVIQQVRVPIHETDNVGDVHDRLMLLGGKLVLETVDADSCRQLLKPIAQSENARCGEFSSCSEDI